MPPPAYWKALRAISETAVAMRVWSWASKPSRRGDLAGALAGGHDVVLVPDRQREERQAHAAAPRATTTVTSSRPRLKSR